MIDFLISFDYDYNILISLLYLSIQILIIYLNI
jgi:hypothetical protein